MNFDANENKLNSSFLDGQLLDNDQRNCGEQTLLDEAVHETVIKSLKAVGKKFSYVLVPRQGQELLKEWDLWGPLILCLMVSILSYSASEYDGHGGPEFAQVFVIFWFGAAVVTLNSKLLGSAVSFLQTVCVLGYCIFPLVICLFVCRAIALLGSSSSLTLILRLTIVFFGLVYSSYASFVFVYPTLPKKRVVLSVYPVVLFYLFLSSLVFAVPGK